jgi:hypothetical protein
MTKKNQQKEAAAPPRVVRRRIIEEMQQEAEPAAPRQDRQEPEQQQEESGYEETDDIRDFSGYDRNLREYMIEKGTTKDYTATLYKYDTINKNKQFVVHSQVNEIMTLHDVGMSFGSGEYRYLVTFPPESRIGPKAFRFNIHTVYDDYRKKAGLSDLPDPRMNGARPGGSVAETFELMKMMVELIKPMMSPAANNNPMDFLMSSYRMTQDVLKDNLKSNVSLYRQLAEIEKAKEPEAEESGPGMMETIIPLIEKFAPLILGNNLQSAALVQSVKSAPAFNELINQPSELKKLVSAIDEKLGASETNQILKKLNVRRPG